MKLAKKRVFTSIIVCIMACVIISMPVLAASTSKTVAKMNALDGTTAVQKFTVTSSGEITQVKIYLNVASGTDPFAFYLVSPSGTEYEIPSPSTKNGTYYTTVFNGEDAKGTWYCYLENLGITYDPIKIYPASTVTPTFTITTK